MSTFTFQPATRAQAKARIALAGPSGSGKTFTALTLATAFGGRIAVIDTERGSASKYARVNGRGLFTFDALNLHRFDPRDLPKALAAAAAKGYDTVVIDSLSKFWAGAGGMLEQVDNAAKRSYGGNSFGGWKEARPMESEMIEAILGYPGHVIVTMRVKTAYEVVENERGRKEPRKIGLQPVQRDGIEYEFDLVGDMDLENTLVVSKSRCPELAGAVIRRPDAQMAHEILAWLSDGAPAMTAADYRAQALDDGATYRDLRALYTTVSQAGLLGAAVTDEFDEPLNLGQLIINRGKAAEAREQFTGNGGGQDEPAQAPSRQRPARAAEPDPWQTEPASQPEQPPARPEQDTTPAQPGAPAGQEQPPAEPEQDGGQPENPPGNSWVDDWYARLEAVTDVDTLNSLQRELGPAIRGGMITPDSTVTLTTAVTERRRALMAGASA